MPQTPPAPPAQTPLIALFSPGVEFQSGAMAPYTVPITVSNLPEVGTLTLRVTYNPMVLRAQAAVPEEVRRLAPPRTDSGNAAALLYGARLVGRAATLNRVVLERPLISDDSAIIRAALADTMLERALRAARLRAYRVVPLMLADTGRMGYTMWRVRTPNLFPSRGMNSLLEGLTLRGYERLRRGQAAGAADLRAAIGVGLMMYEREPTTWGSASGLRAVQRAATLLARAARRDTALAGAAARAAEWADRRNGALMNASRSLALQFDSALAAVVDTSLPFSVRAEMLYYGSIGEVFAGPWRAFAGPSGAAWRRVRAYQQHPDPDFVAVAQAADTVLTRIERVGRWARLRGLLRGQ